MLLQAVHGGHPLERLPCTGSSDSAARCLRWLLTSPATRGRGGRHCASMVAVLRSSG
jgi:hypothetical protein